MKLAALCRGVYFKSNEALIQVKLARCNQSELHKYQGIVLMH